MTDFQYCNRSINSLVQELNSLGNRSVSIYKTELMAVQTGQNRNIRRFQSKSYPQKQFFKCHQSDKKYFYSHVVSQLNQSSLKSFMKSWQLGYNCTILVQNHTEQVLRLIDALKIWIKNTLIYCIALNQQNQLFDVFGQVNIAHRELIENNKYYQIDERQNTKILSEYLDSINQNFKKESSLIDITFKNPVSYAELHITLLPTQIFTSDCNPPFSLIKTQLIQILNYIKINPNKRYEHISKLITKRLPMTNYLTKILMSDSCNLVINFIESARFQENDCLGRFQLFDKISVVSNLLRKADHHVVQIGIIKSLFFKSHFINQNSREGNRLKGDKSSKSERSKEQLTSPIGRLNLKTQNQHQQQDQDDREKKIDLLRKQLQFCRSLQRKTHKYSISPSHQALNLSFKQKTQINQPKNSNQTHQSLEKKTISKYDVLTNRDFFGGINIEKQSEFLSTAKPFESTTKIISPQTFSETEQIILLKAQHSRQISQYHQTIQLLNRKIMVLTKQLNLQELYKIHQRQIMLLELKIKELREDFLELLKEQTNQKALNQIIKRLTEQVKLNENSSTVNRISQGRLFMLQKQIKEIKQKLSASEKARSVLALEVDTLTKRLKIRDTQIEKINQEDIEKYQCEVLSTTEEQILQDAKHLLKAVKNQERNAAQFLIRKISLILCDLSKSRDIILECNDFLVQLMEILDLKLGKKTPEIVLDCNKFIRSFLMDNLAIF